MSLDPATLRRIARLARLHVTDAEVATWQHELNAILGWIAQLEEVDVADVAPMTGPETRHLPLREDVVTDGGVVEKILANAPEREGNFFTVPKVVE